MGEVHDGSPRRAVVWSTTARDLARANKEATSVELRALVSRLVEETGNPRWACWRFIRAMGVRSKRPYRNWTAKEKQELLALVKDCHVERIAKTLRRSPNSIWHMLRRLGVSTKLDVDGFTQYQLAEALHVRVEKVQGWIDRGWLRIQKVQRGGRENEIISADEFCEFCKKYAKDVAGPRLKFERLEFVRMYVFPPSHAESLDVRESKKERAAYNAQVNGESREGKAPASREQPDEDDSAMGATA